MDDLFNSDSGGQFRCPGCGRVMPSAGLRAGERFKCAKCKKLMRFGPRLFDANARGDWQTARLVLLVACIAATLWCVTVGYGFGSRTGRWVAGFGGSLVVWLVAVGCIALAASTTQNNGVLVSVTGMMAGVALFFIERLGEQVGDRAVAAWREEFAAYDLWAPALIVGGLLGLAGSLVLQSRWRSI